MKRRTKTAAAVLAIGSLALAGCASGDSAESADGLVWSMWIGSTEDQTAWQAVGEAGAAASGVNVTLQGAPFADYWTKLSTQLGTSAAPCIVSMQSLRINQFNSGLLPLDDLIAGSDIDLAEFDQGALDAMQVDGQQYAIPYDTGPMVLFYNKDAFAAAGVADPAPGWTADEFDAATAKLKDAGQVGFASTVEDLFLESSVLAYNGGRVLDENGEFTFDDSAFGEGVEWIAEAVQDGRATVANGPDNTADDNAFVNGSAASVVGGPWLLLDFNAKTDFEIGVATLPAGPNGGGTFSAGSGFGISSECADPEAALSAIAGMTSEEVLTSLAEQGRAFPARTAAQQVWFDNAGIDGLQEAMDAALETAIPLPGSAKGDQFNQLLVQYGPQMVNGDKPADEVLPEIATQLGS
ncbi:sugar ABC transporter substrate-binding protein [Pseudoclavibacter sp. RFBG4]|uniref:ABC transporter substrate-binding protein n=1 Tax=unclassified Pseudoclavibacter TaxID=2615177 RepID=UPI000CE739E2|nr:MULTISPECIES: sugar ABC transporter substrate-binding protein [unclassified Pseudoclavibacter]PPF37094.1 sugar ABC transporter substrate-binding protein [Pseudoclavibacter sp. AY1H1]PPG01845.1 sugar ABC transporter substrate-binding protein [Pseudoclavibacter sp. RFBI5]PPG26790.1 sugar ABC transporter substrate-binding protein [Pseudoclavibacter sp. RFBG4]